MKRKPVGQSTTNTPSPRNFGIGIPGPVLAIAPVTVVTLPLAAHVLAHQGVGWVALIGLWPLLPFFLFSFNYTIGSMLEIGLAVVRMRDARVDPADRLDDMWVRVTNPLIALMTLTPLKRRNREPKTTDRSQARAQQGPPSVERLLREWPELFEWLASNSGRHARLETTDPPPRNEAQEPRMAA